MTTANDARFSLRARHALRLVCATAALAAALAAPPHAAGAAGGAYSKPYALLEAQRQMQVADTRPAFVMKVDGRNMSIDRPEPVPPGKKTTSTK